LHLINPVVCVKLRKKQKLLQDCGLEPNVLDYIQSRYHIAHLPMSNKSVRADVARWLIFTEMFDTFGPKDIQYLQYQRVFDLVLASNQLSGEYDELLFCRILSLFNEDLEWFNERVDTLSEALDDHYNTYHQT